MPPERPAGTTHKPTWVNCPQSNRRRKARATHNIQEDLQRSIAHPARSAVRSWDSPVALPDIAQASANAAHERLPLMPRSVSIRRRCLPSVRGSGKRTRSSSRLQTNGPAAPANRLSVRRGCRPTVHSFGKPTRASPQLRRKSFNIRRDSARRYFKALVSRETSETP